MRAKHSTLVRGPRPVGRWIAVALGVAVLAVAAVGAATAGNAALPATITIGMLDSLTGSAGFCGVEEVQAAAIAVKEAKRMHYLGKTQISLKVLDDRTNLEQAASGIGQLIDEKVAVVVGPCIGAGANVTMPITTRAGMPHVITTASAADVSPPNVFRAGIPVPRYASKVITLLKARGVKKVAVFYDTSVPTIAQSVWGLTQQVALKSYKIEVAALEAAPVSTSGLSDFSSQVAKLIQAKPDAIGVLLQGAPNLTVVNQLRQGGYTGPIWGQQGMLAPFYLAGGKNTDGTLIPVSFAPGLGPASSKKFAKAFEQRYGRFPTELGAHGYDAMWMAIRAIKLANSTDHEKIIKALASIKSIDGAQGHVRFNALGDAVGTGFVAEVRDGKVVGLAK